MSSPLRLAWLDATTSEGPMLTITRRDDNGLSLVSGYDPAVSAAIKDTIYRTRRSHDRGVWTLRPTPVEQLALMSRLRRLGHRVSLPPPAGQPVVAEERLGPPAAPESHSREPRAPTPAATTPDVADPPAVADPPPVEAPSIKARFQGDMVRVQISVGHPKHDALVAIIRAAGGRQRKLVSSCYYLLPPAHVAGVIKALQNIGVDTGAFERILLRVAARADELRQRMEDAETIELRVPDGLQLYAHQEEGVRFLLGREAALLADDMGLGKTVQTVIAAENEVPAAGSILVLCPSTVTYNWTTEIERWAPGATVGVVRSTRKHPVPATRYVICSFDTAKTMRGAVDDKGEPILTPAGKRKMVDSPVRAELLRRRWSLVICDEAHNLKNEQSARHKFARKLTRDVLWLLTGTPVMNTPIDLYGLLALAKHRLAHDRFAFGKRYCDAKYNGFGWDFSGASNLEELGREVSDFLLRRTKDDELDLPGKNRVSRIVHVPAKVAHATFSDIGEMMAQRRELALAKVAATWERAEAVLAAGEKVILFSEYIDVLDELERRCSQAEVGAVRIDGSVKSAERTQRVETFQSDASCRVFLGQSLAAGVGITLTAARSVIFNDLMMVPAWHQQAEDRAYRIGQTGRVTVTYMLAKADLDVALWAMLKSKIEVIATFEGALEDSDDAIRVNAQNLLAAVQRLRTRPPGAPSEQW